MNTFFINLYITIILGCSAMCFVPGRLVSQGKCDSFIAGYGTMPKEKQAEYDITRVRRVTSSIAYTMGVVLSLLCITAFLPAQYAIATNIILIVIAIIIAAIATTYGDRRAKKR